MNKTGNYIQNKKNVLSIYLTADYPEKGNTQEVIIALQNAGADLIEVGIPFSDPLADGKIIQKSSQQSLNNGFKLDHLFEDLKGIQKQVDIPLVLMGYFNTALTYGMDRFLEACKSVGVDTLILPDLPLEIYLKKYHELFLDKGISPVFLISPQTTEERILQMEKASNAFIYAVADNSITGSNKEFSAGQLKYFERIQKLQLSVPVLIGFGISDHIAFRKACEYAQGAIIGSAFIDALSGGGKLKETVTKFIKSIKNEEK